MLFRIIPAGDVDIISVDGKQQIVILRAERYVRQTLATKLKSFLGEWFLNLREGVPYYRDVLVHNPDIQLIRTLFRRVILSVQEVSAVSKLEIDYDPLRRRVAVEFDAELVTGGVLLVRQPDSAFIVTLRSEVP